MFQPKLLLTAAAVIFLFSCKKDNDDSGALQPVATEVGAPSGSPVTQTIDGTGGTVASPDGLFEVIIPGGALSSPVSISIQQVANHCHGGIAGTAYRLTPDGQTFDTAVTLLYHYTDAAVSGTHPYALGIAFQLSDKTWTSFVNIQTDTANQTIAAQTEHFTDYAPYTDWQIDPASGEVNINDTKSITVKHLERVADPPGPDGESLAPLVGTMSPVSSNTQDVKEWYVNGVSYGDYDVGFIAPFNPPTVTYNAPESVPQANPVAVAAKIEVPGRPVMQLVSNITVKGAGRYKLEIKETALSSNVVCYCMINNYTDAGSIEFHFDADGYVVPGTPENAAPTFTYVGTAPGICTSVTHPLGTIHIVTIGGRLTSNNSMRLDVSMIIESAGVTSTMLGTPCSVPVSNSSTTLTFTNFNTLFQEQSIPNGFGTVTLTKL